MARAAGTNFSLTILVLLLLPNCAHKAQHGEFLVNLLEEGGMMHHNQRVGPELVLVREPTGAVLPLPPPSQSLGELLPLLAPAGLVGHFQDSKRANWLK